MISEPRAPVIVIGDPEKKKILPPEIRHERNIVYGWTACLFLLGFALFLWIFSPGEGLRGGKILTIEKGTPVVTVLKNLKQERMIRFVFPAKVLMRMYGDDTKVLEGEYYLEEGSWLHELIRQIAKGDHRIPTLRVTFPEGITSKEMGEILRETLPDFNEEAFLALAEQKEGYLFPNTYDFFASVKPERVVEKLTGEFSEQLKPIIPEIEASGKTLSQIVIMASLLEGEARTQGDREVIAGILWRRIREGMPLQVDATFKYLLGKGSSALTVTDLSVDSPYNTYQNKGLPPGPINNPGLEAIRAAFMPKSSPYLFYLHDEKGNIHFAKTFEEHKENKARYLR